ncbi:MAG: DUF4262 domain-containing protein [Bacteroidota bacterium]|nr:DUF4262 domain-containing protein [Bacteroidota bacterium]
MEEQDKKQKYFKIVDENIAKTGYHITAVLEETNFTPFSYSTGVFDNFKIPEIFISGLGPNLSGELIKKYVDNYKLNDVPINQTLKDFTDRFPVVFIQVKNEQLSDYVLSSIRHYGKRNYEYIQLVFPDLKGKFPNENGYDYDQEILGNFIRE